MPKKSDVVNQSDYDRPIDVVKKVEDIREEALEIPAGFQWCNIDISDDAQCQEVYDLLT